MNPVEIEEAVSTLVDHPFDRQEFAYTFFAAYGCKSTTIKRVRHSKANHSDNYLGGGSPEKHGLKEYFSRKTYTSLPVI